MALILLIFFIFSSLPCDNGEPQLPNDGCQSGIYCERREQNLPICPAGFFCPEGSITPVPCPPGTFRSEGAALMSHSCLTCPVDFFNPMPGQKACLPCGSEAEQPTEGQETCICLGKSQVFQPRDAHCTCPPGYLRSSGDGRHCVRKAYDICRDSASRNQEGQCLSKKGWARYCSEKVCAVPRDYQGYDKALGLCICQTESLESVCDSQCRRQQRDTLQITCREKNTQLIITYRNGSKTAVFLEELRTVLLRPYFSVRDVCTSEQSKFTHPMYIVKMSGKGFLGVYNPDPQRFHNFIMLNEASSHLKNRPSSATPPVESGQEEQGSSRVQSLRSSNSTSKITFTGILNPTTCINVNVTLMFIVSKEHYPVYDVNNLYNTNADFDWGDLRSLQEEVRETSQKLLLFLFQFQHAGAYVLRLSSNRHKRMYVRVVPLGGQCYEEGPFFPTTPRHVVQVGIAKHRDLLLKPDWAAIIGVITGLLLLLVTIVILTLFCQGLSWSQKGSPCPAFRRQQLKYNLDSYCSRVPTVSSVKKCHPSLQNKSSADDDSCGTDGTACFPKRGDAWETEEQIDLESFNTNVFFELLLNQSLSVTAKLGHFKEEVKTIYRKLTSEISSLKNLWIKTLSIPGGMEACDSSTTEAYLSAKQQAEEEMQRRTELAAEYEESVNKQLQLLQHDLKCQEEHCVLFSSALREAVRLAEMLTNDTVCKGNQTLSQTDDTSLLAQIEAASSKMWNMVIQESHRLKAWGVLGEGVGAHLLNEDQTRILTKEELVDSNGTARAPDVVCVDPITGFLTPCPHCTILLTSRCPGPVPSNHFLHPKTGKVLPIAGNIGYDPTRSRLVCTVDSALGTRCKPEMPIFPYIPYPICPSTNLPVKTKLPVLCPEKMFSMGGLMVDPATGIEVPVLGVTIHPDTGQPLTVGGTYLNPLTGTVTPLEIWGPMAEPEGGKIVPVLGVGLDSDTGEATPLGGLVGSSGNLMLLGDSFTEPLSGKTTQVHGAHLWQGKVLPHSGSYQAVLDADWLESQTHVVNALKQFEAPILVDRSLVEGRLTALKASIEDMKKSFTTRLYHATHWLQNLEKKREIASSLKSNGGKLGTIKYPGTEMWMPAVFGMKIPDPSGSCLMVPILGIDCDWNTRQPCPLAGTMEDRDGKGLVPIAIGARTISPITGETGPVIGAQTNPWTHNVVPTVQSLGALPRRVTDPDLVITAPENDPHLQLSFLEKEINSRQTYWHYRREKEEGLLKKLNSLFLHVLGAAKEGKAKKIKYKEKVKDIEEMCCLLKRSSLQEVERRTSKCFSSQLATEASLLFKADRDEKEQETRYLVEIRRALEKLMEFIEKMKLEEERIYLQLVEREKQRSHISGTEAVTNLKVKKVMLALVLESQKCIEKQQASVETAYSKLEYLRDLSNIQAQQAKVLFSGSQQCFENYETTRFYGISGMSHSTCKDVQQSLIPLLQSAVQILKEKSKSSVSPERSGYSSRSTLKASAAHSEAPRGEAGQENTSASIASSVLPTSHSKRISYVQQEIQRRFLFEKHACELAHLELSLLMEEITTISSFSESSKAKERECHNRNWFEGMKASEGTEATGTKESLLKELWDHHHHTEQSLRQKQLEEMEHSGLSPDLTVPKQTLHFLEEIPHQLSVCLLGLQTPDSKFTEQQKPHSQEVQHSPDSLTQILHVSAVKIVKLEALRQACLYRVLDLYSNLQIQTCPEGVTRVLNSFDYRNNGEEVAREVARTREKEQVARTVAFLQKHHQEGDLLKGLKEESEAELRNMQAQFKLELQTQTEEKLQAREKEVIQETRGDKWGNLVAYFILSQRHLRETVLRLQDCYRLKEMALRCQKVGTGLEELIEQELLLDDDTKGIAHLLKDSTECLVPVLEFIQTLRSLQLREAQLKEMVRSLKGCIQEKVMDEANTMANELKKLREEKMRMLEEQLKLFLENKRTRRNISRNFDPFQNSMRECGDTKSSLEKGLRPDLLKLNMKPEEDQEMQQNNSPLSSISKPLWVPGTHHKTDDQLLLFLTKSIKVLKQAEHLMASRIVLLNPQLTTSSLSAGDKTKCMKPSFLLGLLKDVNDELRSHAVAAGLLESQTLDKKTASTSQDTQDASVGQGEPTAVDPAALSTREFVVYQYGISILHFLKLHIDAPEIDLCVASSLPLSNATGNAFRNSFFYQNSKNKLFVLRDCLSSVGGFLLLLVHCQAQITAADFNQDASSPFLRLFYQALQACLGEMFCLRLQLSAVLQGDKPYGISQMLLKEEPFSKEETNLISQLFEVKVKTLADMEAFEKKNLLLHAKFEEPLKDKLLVKQRKHLLHSSSSCENGSLGWRTRSEKETCTSLTASELEDKVDELTEELVRIIEDEHQFLNNKGNEDLCFYYLEITSLEKDCLVKQINALEEKIALMRKV